MVSQSVGFDAGKKIKGRKRFMTVDTLGLVLRVLVSAANVGEREGGKQVLKRLRQSNREQREKVRSGFSSQLYLYILNKTWFFSCDRIPKQAIYVPGCSTSQNRVAPVKPEDISFNNYLGRWRI